MKVYYGNKGSEYYIMCRDFNEIYVFDMFGNLCGTNGCVDSCNNWQLVDFLSFVGIGNNNCELLYNGYKAELNMNIFLAIKPFRDYGKFLGTIFNVPHEDDLGRYSQIIFVFPKGTITANIINNQFPKRLWNKLLK